jgi:predicted neuraminidase
MEWIGQEKKNLNNRAPLGELYIHTPARILMLACLISGIWGVCGWADDAQLAGELIFPPQEKHCHGSSLVECPDGSLLACWFYGSGERNADDVLIQGARKRNGEKEWSPVFLMADTPGFPDCNPVLQVDGQGRLHLYWITVLAHGWEHSLLKVRTATDYQSEGSPKWSWQDTILLNPGKQFADRIADVFKELDPEEGIWAEYAPAYTGMILEAAKDPIKIQTGWMTRIHPTTLPSGRILLPLYSDGFNVCLMAISDDGGSTWYASSPIVGMGPIQPSVARKKDGTLVAYMRDSGGPPSRALKSESKDEGITWSAAIDTEVLNPGSSLEVVVLADGNWLMVFNDTEKGRHSLAAALSDDEGFSWKWKRHLENGPPNESSFAYPSVIQARDGNIQATYTHSLNGQKSIKHVDFNPAWIKQGD